MIMYADYFVTIVVYMVLCQNMNGVEHYKFIKNKISKTMCTWKFYIICVYGHYKFIKNKISKTMCT